MRQTSPAFKNVIFDLDGTLTDPCEGFANSIAFALLKLGMQVPSSEELCRYIGPPIHGTFANLLDTTNAELIEQAVSLYRERLGAEGIRENTVYPGVIEMLTSLRNAECKLFVATAKPLKFAIPILEHCELLRYFTDQYGSKLGVANTPKAELVRCVIDEWSLSPRDTVMVGDRHHDIDGAKANGVHAVGVTYGYGSFEELTHAGADALYRSPVELSAYLMLDS